MYSNVIQGIQGNSVISLKKQFTLWFYETWKLSIWTEVIADIGSMFGVEI